MSLQESIIHEFKSQYSHFTLEESAKLLRINRTRLFRILHGSEMKISEYESFEDAIMRAKGINNSSFLKIAKDCMHKLSSHKVNSLWQLMHEKLLIHNLTDQAEEALC